MCDAMDNMNRLATNMIQCPECDSESITELHYDFDMEICGGTHHLTCGDCNHYFTESD